MTGAALFVIIGIVVVAFVQGLIWASRYARVGPNEVLIISGRRHSTRGSGEATQARGFRIVKGGGTFVMPVIEKCDVLSLEVQTVEIQAVDVWTKNGAVSSFDATAQVKVNGDDDDSIAAAAECFLSKGTSAIRGAASQIFEARLRDVLGTITTEDAYHKRSELVSSVHKIAATDLVKMGLEIVSFTVRDIREARPPQLVDQLNK